MKLLKLFSVLLVMSLTIGCNDESDRDQTSFAEKIDIGGQKLVRYTEERPKCDHRDPYRNAYFGDTHVHTSLSFDAYARGTEARPEDAFEFAKGQKRVLQTGGSESSTRKIQLDRPLDFMVTTEHVDLLGETSLCRDDESEAYNLAICEKLRNGTVTRMALKLAEEDPRRFYNLCGPGGKRCTQRASNVWQEIERAAQKAYDKSSDCQFTAFKGYEYTNTRGGNVLHRNLIFRNKHVPENLISSFSQPLPSGMFKELDEKCIERDNKCDAVALPHNSNQSAGNMFRDKLRLASNVESRQAALKRRKRLEPVIELYQHKGSMECRNGPWKQTGSADSLCKFEKIRPDDQDKCDGEPGTGGISPIACISEHNYYQGILQSGIEKAQTAGFNPHRVGAIASTDTHNAIPGMVREKDWPGHMGPVESTPRERLETNSETSLIKRKRTGPGGLAGVWAVENSRDAIFEAIKRRETFATSGPIIKIRLFGGSNLPGNMCQTQNFAETGYKRGVPMGQSLPRDLGKAPKFAVKAIRDPGSTNSPSTPLQRLQIIKGTLSSSGNFTQKVYEIAGDSNSNAAVKLETCQPEGEGYDQLCRVWRDPDFNKSTPGFYYARVLENPTCRWSTRDCKQIQGDQKPSVCSADSEIPKTIQERAWTSPIWYEP